MEKVEEKKAVTFSDMQIFCQKATATLAKMQEVFGAKFSDENLDCFLWDGLPLFTDICFEIAAGRKPHEYEVSKGRITKEIFTKEHLNLLIRKRWITQDEYDFIFTGLHDIFLSNDFDVQIKNGYVVLKESGHDAAIEKFLLVDYPEALK